MLIKMRDMMKPQKGFTLVELMIVVAVIGILAAIAIPKMASANDAAKGAKIAADLRTIDSAVAIAVAQGNTVEAGPIPATVSAKLASGVPTAPTGNFTGPGHAAATAIPAGGYVIILKSGDPRAAIGTLCAEDI